MYVYGLDHVELGEHFFVLTEPYANIINQGLDGAYVPTPLLKPKCLWELIEGPSNKDYGHPLHYWSIWTEEREKTTWGKSSLKNGHEIETKICIHSKLNEYV